MRRHRFQFDHCHPDADHDPILIAHLQWIERDADLDDACPAEAGSSDCGQSIQGSRSSVAIRATEQRGSSRRQATILRSAWRQPPERLRLGCRFVSFAQHPACGSSLWKWQYCTAIFAVSTDSMAFFGEIRNPAVDIAVPRFHPRPCCQRYPIHRRPKGGCPAGTSGSPLERGMHGISPGGESLRHRPRDPISPARDRRSAMAACGAVQAPPHSACRQQGVAPGEVVAGLSHNSVDYLVLLHACLRAGAVFAPMNVALRHDELVATMARLDAETDGCFG